MKLSIKRLGAVAAAAACAATGAVATAAPASASNVGPIGRCPNNFLCFFSGPNLTGTILFQRNGSTMHDDPWIYFGSDALDRNGNRAVSAANATLGRFCTYTVVGAGQTVRTNTLNPRTSGNLADHRVLEISEC